MKLFTDQKRNPILTGDLAGALIEAVEWGLDGLYHVAGPETVTRYEFGRRVCEVFGYDTDLLIPIKMQDFDYLAERPLDSSLDTAKFRGATGFAPRKIGEALAWIRDQGVQGSRQKRHRGGGAGSPCTEG